MMMLTCNSCFDRDYHKLHLPANKVLCNVCGKEIAVSDFAKRALVNTTQVQKQELKRVVPNIATKEVKAATRAPANNAPVAKQPRVYQAPSPDSQRHAVRDANLASLEHNFPAKEEADARAEQLKQKLVANLDAVNFVRKKGPPPPSDIAKYYEDD